MERENVWDVHILWFAGAPLNLAIATTKNGNLIIKKCPSEGERESRKKIEAARQNW